MDDHLVTDAHAKKYGGVDTSHLSKIRNIDVEAAERTLRVTTQKIQHIDDLSLPINYGTKGRTLQYKKKNEYFFMDTFFDTNKSGKLSRSHSCCQDFVTDKVFMYVIPMKSKYEVLQAVK